MPLFIWCLIMKLLWISGLLLGCALPAAARDPFALPLKSCGQPAIALNTWQLQGMVGRESHYLGWLRSAQGEIVAITSDRPLPFTGWEIETFMPFRLVLSTAQDCSPQRVTLQIKGRKHDKDRSSAAAAKQRSPGQ